MTERQEFRIGDERTCELIVERAGPTTLEIYIAHYDGFVGHGPETVPLGLMLRALGFTAEDCAKALAGEERDVVAAGLLGERPVPIEPGRELV